MLVRSRVMLDNHLRGILKAFGLKVGKVDPGRLDQRVKAVLDERRTEACRATSGNTRRGIRHFERCAQGNACRTG